MEAYVDNGSGPFEHLNRLVNTYEDSNFAWKYLWITTFFLAEHVTAFKQDLSQLVDNLNEFTYLEIFGNIYYEKVEAYRLMAQTLFPHSRVDVEVTKFRLWLWIFVFFLE